MKKDYLKELNDLISVMTSSEKLLASKQLNVGYSNLKANDKKMIQLFKSVKSGKQYNYEKLKQKVSPKSNKDSFNRLIRRLTYRLEESLILEQNINRKDAYSEIFRIRHKLKKQLIQSQILLSRGMVLKAINLWKRIERDAKSYELFNELIEARSIYYSISIARNNNLNAQKLKNELNNDFRKRESLEQIRHLINDYELTINLNKNDKIKIRYLKNTVSKVDKICSKIYTDNGMALSYLLKLELADFTEDYKQYISEGNKLLELLESKKSVYSASRIIYLHNKIARYYIYLFNFKEAERRADLAKNMFSKSLNSNYLNTIDCLFLSYFFRGKFDHSLALLTNVVNLDLTKKFPVRKSKLHYYMATNFFLLNDYKNSALALNQTTEIEKDKEGWNIWIRLLRLMILIEQKKYDLLEYEIESFRKYIQRTESNDTERINLILSLLIELERREFDFKVAAKNKAKDLERLQNDPFVQWNINSPELIQFHNWYQAKCINIEYKPVF